MTPTILKFITHKPAEDPEDCQDSLCAVPERGVFAVADGAGNSFFPREWAECLTSHFASDAERALGRGTFTAWLRAAHKDWATIIERMATAPKPPFLVVNGYHGRTAAAATFIGVRLGQPSDGGIPWEAIALGDSCLFHARADGKVDKYPLVKSQDFSFDTQALSSYPDKNPVEPIFFGSENGRGCHSIVEGDVLILASDALSRWLIRREEMDQPVWGHLLSLETDETFLEFVSQARAEANEPMVNDDVALVVVRFGEPHSIYRKQLFVSAPAAPLLRTQPVAARTPEPVPVPDPTLPSHVVLPDGPPPPKASSYIKARPRPRFLRYGLIVLAILAILAAAAYYITDRQGEIRRLKNQLTEAEKSLAADQKKLDEIVQAYTKKLEALSEEIVGLKKKLAEAENHLAVEHQSLREMVQAHSKSIAVLSADQMRLIHKVNKAANKLNDLRAKLSELSAAVAKQVPDRRIGAVSNRLEELVRPPPRSVPSLTNNPVNPPAPVSSKAAAEAKGQPPPAVKDPPAPVSSKAAAEVKGQAPPAVKK